MDTNRLRWHGNRFLLEVFNHRTALYRRARGPGSVRGTIANDRPETVKNRNRKSCDTSSPARPGSSDPHWSTVSWPRATRSLESTTSVAGIPANLEQAHRCNGLSPGRFTFLRADIQAPELTDIVAGTNPDVIFHLAAQVDLRASVSDPQFDARSNVLGTINVLEASRRAGVQRIVYAASGGSRYGAPTRLPVDETAQLDPLSPYAAAKLAGELYLRAYAGMYGIAPICLALANVYGPRQNPHGEAGVIAVFGSSDDHRPPGHRVRGRHRRPRLRLRRRRRRRVCARRSGSLHDRRNLQHRHRTADHRHRSAPSDFCGPRWVSAPRYAAARTGELQAIALDATKAEKELGWKPAVDLVEGIQRTIRWLRATLEPEPTALVDA